MHVNLFVSSALEPSMCPFRYFLGGRCCYEYQNAGLIFAELGLSESCPDRRPTTSICLSTCFIFPCWLERNLSLLDIFLLFVGTCANGGLVSLVYVARCSPAAALSQTWHRFSSAPCKAWGTQVDVFVKRAILLSKFHWQ